MATKQLKMRGRKLTSYSKYPQALNNAIVTICNGNGAVFNVPDKIMLRHDIIDKYANVVGRWNYSGKKIIRKQTI